MAGRIAGPALPALGAQDSSPSPATFTPGTNRLRCTFPEASKKGGSLILLKSGSLFRDPARKGTPPKRLAAEQEREATHQAQRAGSSPDRFPLEIRSLFNQKSHRRHPLPFQPVHGRSPEPCCCPAPPLCSSGSSWLRGSPGEESPAPGAQQPLLQIPRRLFHRPLKVKLHKSPWCSPLGAARVLQKAPSSPWSHDGEIQQPEHLLLQLPGDRCPASERGDWRSTAQVLYNSRSSPPSSTAPGRGVMMDGAISDCFQSGECK